MKAMRHRVSKAHQWLLEPFSRFLKWTSTFRQSIRLAGSPGGGIRSISLACPDGSYYVGSAKDVSRRTGLHQAGRGAKLHMTTQR